MRHHFSFAVTVLVTLSFVAGTTGCQSTGGPWYNPKSYTWTNPFAKEGQELTRTSSSLANTTKPSLNSSPNISPPPSGYSDEAARFHAGHAGSHNGAAAEHASDPGAYANPMTSYNSASVHSGYSNAAVAPSEYPPSYNSAGAVTPYQPTSIYQYQPELAPNQNQMPYGASDYPGSPHQATRPVNPVSYAPAGDSGSAVPAGNYAPFGPTQQNNVYAGADPYATAPQQPSSVPPAGFYDPQQGAPAYPSNNGVPVASPYPPHQPAGGYNF